MTNLWILIIAFGSSGDYGYPTYGLPVPGTYLSKEECIEAGKSKADYDVSGNPARYTTMFVCVRKGSR